MAFGGKYMPVNVLVLAMRSCGACALVESLPWWLDWWCKGLALAPAGPGVGGQGQAGWLLLDPHDPAWLEKLARVALEDIMAHRTG